MNYNIKLEIEKCIKNAKEKLDDAEHLANKGSYGTASSILVTAFEERSKAVTLQLIDLGVPLGNLNEIEYIFTQHHFRHYIGFFVECFSEIIKDLEKVLILIKKDPRPEAMLELFNNPENIKQLKSWLVEKIDSFSEKIEFYRDIENNRQKGLYVDVLRGNTPTDMSKKDYDDIKKKLNCIHWISFNLSSILESEWWNKGEEKKIFSKDVNSIKELPFGVQKTIKVVRKKRGKLFQTMAIKLDNFKQDIVESKEWEKFVDKSIPKINSLGEKYKTKKS